MILRNLAIKAFVISALGFTSLFMNGQAAAQTDNLRDTTGDAGSGAVSPTPTPTPRPKTTWGGLYIGAFGGANFSAASANTSTVFDANGYFAPQSVTQVNTAGAQKLNGTNIAAGIDVGYNRQRGSFVYGAEFDAGILSGTRSKSTSDNYVCCPGAFTVTQSLKYSWLTTLRPRAGVAVGKKFLVYATGGIAFTKYDYEAAFSDTHNAAFENGSIAKKRIGWIGGAGVEYLWRKNIAFKVEGLHTDFGTVSTTSTNLNINIPPGNVTVNPFTHSISLKGNMVRIGVNFHF
ncbi:MAG: outer membrane beta-barrel protein [Acidobacteriota bacterium]